MISTASGAPRCPLGSHREALSTSACDKELDTVADYSAALAAFLKIVSGCFLQRLNASTLRSH